MLKSDKLRLEIVSILKKNDEMTLGQLRRKLKVSHHYVLTNALELLQELDLIDIIEKKDKLKSKVVRLK